MKRLAALLLAGAVIFCGCQQSTESGTESMEEELIVYKALPLPDLNVEIPERFAATSSDFYEEYYICEDASIICTQDTEGAPYGSVYERAISALTEYEKITTELELLSHELVYAGSLAVQTLEFTYSIGEGDGSINMTCLAGYVTDSENMYIITCKANQDTYAEYRNDFMSVLTSLSLIR